LVAHGLIKTDHSASDYRSLVYTLTDAGRLAAREGDKT